MPTRLPHSILALACLTLLSACEKQPEVDKALDAAQTHTEQAASETKAAAKDLVDATRAAAGAAEQKIEETAAAAKAATRDALDDK